MPTNAKTPLAGTSLLEGPVITLQQMLQAREARAGRQRAMLIEYGRPIISLTPIVPGEIKNSPGTRFLFEAALYALERLCREVGWPVQKERTSLPDTGPEALLVVDALGHALKWATIRVEETHPLGRLWDIDVLCPGEGIITRQTLGAAPRRCLVCDQPAHACARSKQHTQAELINKMEQTINAYCMA